MTGIKIIQKKWQRSDTFKVGREIVLLVIHFITVLPVYTNLVSTKVFQIVIALLSFLMFVGVRGHGRLNTSFPQEQWEKRIFFIPVPKVCPDAYRHCERITYVKTRVR